MRCWLNDLFTDKVGGTPKADIYRELAELHGYHDEGSVKKSISRAKQRRKIEGNKLPDLFRLVEEDGKAVEIEIKTEVLKNWIDKYPDLVEHWWGKDGLDGWIDKIPDAPYVVLNFVPHRDTIKK